MAWTEEKVLSFIRSVADEDKFLRYFVENARRNQAINPKIRKYTDIQMKKRAIAALKAKKRKTEFGIIWLNKKNRKKLGFTPIEFLTQPLSNVKEQSQLSFVEEHKKYIKSKEWAAIKLAFRQDFTRKQECWGCNVSAIVTPHDFHHLHYRTFKCETLDDIIPLCRDCHHTVHDLQKKSRQTIEITTGIFLRDKKQIASKAE